MFSVFLFPAWSAFAGAGAAGEATDLLPPHPAIPPTYWEENRAWIVAVGLFAVLALAALVWLLTRKRPVKPPPPEVEAREALESLAGMPEDGRVVSRVSQVLKRYFIAAFDLPAGELTTTEFRHSLRRSEGLETEVVNEVGEFLQRCDEYKFAPASERVPGAANQAMKFVEDAEACRARRTEDLNAGKTRSASSSA